MRLLKSLTSQTANETKKEKLPVQGETKSLNELKIFLIFWIKSEPTGSSVLRNGGKFRHLLSLKIFTKILYIWR